MGSPSQKQPAAADVIVVGGGPAGCAAALRLARRDLSVIVFERQGVGSSSRDRLRSGEGLIPRALRELADLGIATHDAPWALSRIRRVRTVGPDGAAATDAVSRLGGIVQIDRALFEDDLRRAAARAGVDVRLGWRARRLDYAPGQPIGGVVVQPPGERTTSVLRAPIVIDASGRGALSFRTFDVQRSAGDFGTVVMFFDQVAGLEPDVWETHLFGARQLSVVQLSQIEPGVVRCGLGVSSALQLGARHAHDLFWGQIAQHPALAGRLRGSRVVSRPYVRAGIGYRVRQVTFDGLLLAGDAAGYVNPLFGDGILRALRSARQAAAAAAAALRQGDCTRAGLRIYERQHAARDRVDAMLLGALRGLVRRPGLLLKIASLEWVRHALFSALLRA